MLLFSPGRVADGLRSGALTEHAKARLLVSSIVVGLFVSRASLLSYRTVGALLGAVVVYALFVGGVWSCYRLNARLDDRRFVERYVCLSIPLWTWTMIGYFGLYYAIYFLVRAPFGIDAASYPVRARPFALAYGVAAMPIYFLLLRRYFRRAAPEAAGS